MRIFLAVLFLTIISFTMPDNNKAREPVPDDQTQKPLFSFGIIADVQYCDCEPVGTRYYRSSLSKLAEAVTAALFAGHNHSGNYGNFNMIHFITMKGMVETEEANSFAIVEVYKNKIWIKGYGREKSQILAY
jgi:hypothetical protein